MISKMAKHLRTLRGISREFGFPFCLKYALLKYSKRTEAYYRLVYGKLKETVSDGIREINGESCAPIAQNSTVPVWVCWWQGYENMPELCRICLRSIEENLPENASLTLITKDNYTEYADIPEDICRKLNDVVYPVAIFSDLLRQTLLCRHGGFWIDATMLCTKPLSREFIADSSFWSIKLPESHINHASVGFLASRCMWGSFIQKAPPSHPVNRLVHSGLLEYMRKHNVLIEYFMQNIFIRIGYDNCPAIKTAIDGIAESNTELYTLDGLMNEEFDPDVWDRLTADTALFKLSWKQNYKKQTANGEPTFFGYLCEKYKQ